MEKKQDVIFLHGFGSGKSSTKYIELKGDPRYNVGIVEVDYTTATQDEIVSKFQNIAFKMDDPIVVGHSLGGYLAAIFRHWYGYRTVILNPSPTPWETLKGKLAFDYFDFLKSPQLFPVVPCINIVEMGDEVIDHLKYIEDGTYSRMETVVIQGGDHRFQSFDALHGAIEKLTNQI